MVWVCVAVFLIVAVVFFSLGVCVCVCVCVCVFNQSLIVNRFLLTVTCLGDMGNYASTNYIPFLFPPYT